MHVHLHHFMCSKQCIYVLLIIHLIVLILLESSYGFGFFGDHYPAYHCISRKTNIDTDAMSNIGLSTAFGLALSYILLAQYLAKKNNFLRGTEE